MKAVLMFILIFTLLASSGCAVIDFLDGKHFNHSPSYDQPRYNSGNNHGGGGHSH